MIQEHGALKWNWNNRWMAGAIGALLVLAVTVLLFQPRFRPGLALLRTSYDWLFDLSPMPLRDMTDSEVVIIYMDEESHRNLNQPFDKPWDRLLHAELVNQLKEDGARLIVFDIVFTGPGEDPAANEAFAAAISNHGGVILGADLDRGVSSSEVQPVYRPYAPFEEAAAGWGVAHLLADEDFLVREHFPGLLNEDIPSLSWAVAREWKLPVALDPRQRFKERWINYYGPPGSIPHASYLGALTRDGVAPGFFKDKAVFIGARPRTGYFDEMRDELRSPYSIHEDRLTFIPAVEVQATQTLNLIREDWISRPAPAVEWMIFLGAAGVLGFGLVRFRPSWATILSGASAVVIFLGATVVFATQRVWFPWLIIVAGQIPVALIWAVAWRSLEWYAQERKLQEERRQADARIREQAALLDKAQDAIIVHDLNWKVSYWNRSAERLYGWTAEELVDQSLPGAGFKVETHKMTSVREAVIEKGEWVGELAQMTRAGAPLTVQSRWTLVRNNSDGTHSVLVINTDVTEQKKLEAQFLRTQRMESIGTLAGGIAHDLNNVLAPVLLGVDLLHSKVTDEKSRKILKTIESSARRGSDMVKQVLTFARGNGGERTVLQPARLLKEMDKMVKETFPRSVQMVCRTEPDLWTVTGDSTQLHQVLLNFCVNARDAMPDGGRISINASNVTLDGVAAQKLQNGKPGDYVRLSVSDTGTGIPPEIIDKIFEPFFTTKEVGKGTGLGLSTVVTIIKNHEGMLDVMSEMGKGTTFTVYLPAAQTALAGACSELDRGELLGRGELVLVVDDEPPVREMMQSVLIDHGYRVVTAMNGADAVSVAASQKEKFKLAVVDMMMPVMDGPKAIRSLRELQPDLRCVAVSGLPQLEKIREQIGDAEITFVAKPFTAEKLLYALRQAMNDQPVLNGCNPTRPAQAAIY